MAKYLDYDGLGKVWTKITEKFQKKIKNCTVATDSTGAKWYKVAEGTILKNNTNTDYHIVFDVFDTLDHPSQYAKVRARVRVGSTKGTVISATLQYLEKTSDDGTFYTDWLRMYWKGNETITEGVKVEFWTYLKVAYSGKKFVVESEFDRYKNTTDGGDITFTTNTTSGTPPNVPETPTNTDWHLVSPTYVQSANTAEKAAKDGDGNTISSTYLKLSGGTVTGKTTFKSDDFGGGLFVHRNHSEYGAAITFENETGTLGKLGCITGGALYQDGNGNNYQIITENGGTLNRSLNMKGSDLIIGTNSTTSNDSGDIIFNYGNGNEKARIWTNNEYNAGVGPNYRVYKEDGTNLYEGRLATINEVAQKEPKHLIGNVDFGEITSSTEGWRKIFTITAGCLKQSTGATSYARYELDLRSATADVCEVYDLSYLVRYNSTTSPKATLNGIKLRGRYGRLVQIFGYTFNQDTGVLNIYMQMYDSQDWRAIKIYAIDEWDTTHAMGSNAKVTDTPTSLGAGYVTSVYTELNSNATYWGDRTYIGMQNDTTMPTSGKWWHIINTQWNGNADEVNWPSQFAIPTKEGDGHCYFKYSDGTTKFGSGWKKLVNSDDTITNATNATNIKQSVTSGSNWRPLMIGGTSNGYSATDATVSEVKTYPYISNKLWIQPSTGDVESKGNIFLQENASANTGGIVSKTYNAMLGFDTDGHVGLYGKTVYLRGASKKGTSSGKGLVVQENEIITQAVPMCINPGTASSYNEGLRINKANNNYSIINFGGAADSISGVSSTDWTIGRRGADTSASNYYSPAGTFIFAYGGTNSGSGVTLTTAGGIVATHNIHTKEGLYIGRSFTATSSSGGAKMAYNSTTQCIEFTFPD